MLQVSIEFSTNGTEPGQNLDLTVRADPDSFVGVMAVDQSVLLLDSGNDITKEMVCAWVIFHHRPTLCFWSRDLQNIQTQLTLLL